MPRKKKLFRTIFLLSLVFVIALVALIAFKVNPIIESYLNLKIASLFRNDPSSLYQIKYDSLKIDIYSGDLRVNNLSIKPRKKVLDSLLQTDLEQNQIIDAELAYVSVIDLKWYRFLKTGNIELDKIELLDGNVTFYNLYSEKNEKKVSIGNDIFTSDFKSALIHEFDLERADFLYYQIGEDTVQTLSFQNLNLGFSNFYSDSALLKTRRGFNIKNIRLSLDSIETRLVKNYTVQCDLMSFMSLKNQFILKGIRMLPDQERVDMQNYLQLEVNEMDLFRLNYDSLLNHGQIIAERINIVDPYFNYVRPPERLQKDTIRFLPATTFNRIPFPIAIDTLEIRGGTFDFLKHGYNEPTVDLIAEEISLDGLFFSSDPIKLGKNQTFYLSGRAKFLEQSMVDLQFVFPLLHPRDSFTVNLQMDTLDAVRLNPVLKNGKGIKLNQGSINRLKMALFGTTLEASGHLAMDYSNLKLEIVKIDENDFSQSSKKGFLSFMVNTLTKSNNEAGRSSFNEGIIYLERKENYTFLDYTLESLMTGVITTMVPESKGFIKPKDRKKK
jgi:hypothetical protein